MSTDDKLKWDKLAATYVKIRDARSKLKRDFEASDATLKEQQNKIGAVLLKILIDNEVSSIKTKGGTFYRKLDIKPSVADWSALYGFIKENDAFEALERRVKKDFIKSYMEDNEGALPPGVSIVQEYTVTVNRSK